MENSNAGGYKEALEAFRRRAEGKMLPNPQGSSGQPLPPSPDGAQAVMAGRAGQPAGNAPQGEKTPEAEKIVAALIQRLKFLSAPEEPAPQIPQMAMA